ncbi:ATP-binding cassette domain-containing protein [Buchananella hordeovulneris]|uniref:ATP-binding cassette domain-containing protein n=1 Tax=Buchananella hordeovulneris TaxID=52770 RepID=UPI0026DDACFC|nr:ATP-binding cassette domain-containing protein [Buchananella hordeovulneris]MDO5081630.1 ATP-binding cassette domain-containing protein [Buchananella hordeovulneris]
MIAVHGATVRFGRQVALTAFAGAFPAGQVTVLVGAAGAGKSTVLRLLAGQVLAEGERWRPPSGVRLGYQAATGAGWSHLTVRENLEFVSRIHGVGTSASRTADLLQAAGLSPFRDRLARQLSGGMRQKLGFVLASLHAPELLLLDEPTTGVDPASRSQLWTLIAAAAAEGAAVVLSTSYFDEAERAHQLFLLHAGRTLAAGTPAEVCAASPGQVRGGIGAEGVPSGVPARWRWQRGARQYWWQPVGTGATEVPDLENAAIAYALHAEEEAGQGVAGPGVADGGQSGNTMRTAASEATGAAAGAGDYTGPTPAPVAGGGAERDESSRPRSNVATRPGQVLVRARGITRRFSSFAALQEVDIDVQAGEIVGLIGGNGAGKSTLMRILLGLDQPTSGEAQLLGAPPGWAERRRLGYVAQGLALAGQLGARQNLAFVARVQGVQVPAAARAWVARLPESPVRELPRGTQRQLACLAARLHRPALLVLDEPTSGMDPLARARLWRDLRAEAAAGVGILVTTHYMEEARHCDRLVLLRGGRVAGEGSLRDIVGRRTAVLVSAADWRAAFRCLRRAGLPVLLAGNQLRVPGVEPEEVAALLEDLPGGAEVAQVPAQLAEVLARV